MEIVKNILPNNYFAVAHDIWTSLTFVRKLEFFLIFLLTVFVTIVDVLSLASVGPFIAFLSGSVGNQPQVLAAMPLVNKVYLSTELIAVIFLSLTIFSGVLKISLMYATQWLAYAIGNDLSIGLFQKILKRKYTDHLMVNSSSIVNVTVRNVEIIIGGGVLPLLNAVAAIVILFAILCALIYINLGVTLIVFIVLAGAYFVVGFCIRKRIIFNGEIINRESSRLIRTIQEALGGIRDIILSGSHQIYIDQYKKTDINLRKAESFNQFATHAPKLFLETLGMSLLIGIAAYMHLHKNNDASLVMLAVIALASQKMLPLLQQLYVSYSSLSGWSSSVTEILRVLREPDGYISSSENSKLSFKKCIQFKEVTYKHKNSDRYIFEKMTLSVPQGKILGISGPSGVGKSTFLDLITGLLEPESGKVLIDETELNKFNVSLWQKNIAYVPQNIYLSDDSLMSNITFGLPETDLDYNKLNRVVSLAQLDELIGQLPLGIHTQIGERGAFLSGGQRQRIGLARALYREADLMILDEATSALDVLTEKLVMDGIYKAYPRTTMIIVSHRLEMLNQCDSVLELRSNNEFTLRNNFLNK